MGLVLSLRTCPGRAVRAYETSPLRLDDFRHGHAELLLDEYDFAARNQAVVDVDIDGLADLAVEFEHGARPELEQLADFHASTAEYGTPTIFIIT